VPNTADRQKRGHGEDSAYFDHASERHDCEHHQGCLGKWRGSVSLCFGPMAEGCAQSRRPDQTWTKGKHSGRPRLLNSTSAARAKSRRRCHPEHDQAQARSLRIEVEVSAAEKLGPGHPSKALSESLPRLTVRGQLGIAQHSEFVAAGMWAI
jgi:hypothetical protein